MEDLNEAVGIALRVLRGKKSRWQSFSLEDVRDIINGELGLELTEDDDTQVKASLRARNDVTAVSIEGKRWKFVRATGTEIP